MKRKKKNTFDSLFKEKKKLVAATYKTAIHIRPSYSVPRWIIIYVYLL